MEREVLIEEIPLHLTESPPDGHAIREQQNRKGQKNKSCAEAPRWITRLEISY